MKILLLIISFIAISLSQAGNHSYTYFAGTILVENGKNECFFQQVFDLKYKYLDLYFYNYDNDENNINFKFIANETKQIDSKMDLNNYSAVYNLENQGVGIGEYKFCFRILSSWSYQHRIFFIMSLMDEHSFNINHEEVSNQLEDHKEMTHVYAQIDKIFANIHTIQMEQNKYKQHEHISRTISEETFELINYCNIFILIVMMLTYSIHIYAVKALFDSNSLPAKIMGRLY